mmetsp:Transcript_60891/g.170259  ORF Transcript_60891/g.170259 Transcript_60891/m.170259 type:complete len:296 (-) Transcript_60891:1505-2392(-)
MPLTGLDVLRTLGVDIGNTLRKASLALVVVSMIKPTRRVLATVVRRAAADLFRLEQVYPDGRRMWTSPVQRVLVVFHQAPPEVELHNPRPQFHEPPNGSGVETYHAGVQIPWFLLEGRARPVRAIVGSLLERPGNRPRVARNGIAVHGKRDVERAVQEDLRPPPLPRNTPADLDFRERFETLRLGPLNCTHFENLESGFIALQPELHLLVCSTDIGVVDQGVASQRGVPFTPAKGRGHRREALRVFSGVPHVQAVLSADEDYAAGCTNLRRAPDPKRLRAIQRFVVLVQRCPSNR